MAGGSGLWEMNFYKSIVICVLGKKVNIYILYKQFYFAFSSYSWFLDFKGQIGMYVLWLISILKF